MRPWGHAACARPSRRAHVGQLSPRCKGAARARPAARHSKTEARASSAISPSHLRAAFFAAQSSGMPINDDCYTTYSELQTKHKLRWIVYGIDGGSIKVYASGDASKKGREAWADFTSPEHMPDGECRYGVFDLDIQMDDGVHERANAKVSRRTMQRRAAESTGRGRARRFGRRVCACQIRACAAAGPCAAFAERG